MAAKKKVEQQKTEDPKRLPWLDGSRYEKLEVNDAKQRMDAYKRLLAELLSGRSVHVIRVVDAPYYTVGKPYTVVAEEGSEGYYIEHSDDEGDEGELERSALGNFDIYVKRAQPLEPGTDQPPLVEYLGLSDEERETIRQSFEELSTDNLIQRVREGQVQIDTAMSLLSRRLNGLELD